MTIWHDCKREACPVSSVGVAWPLDVATGRTTYTIKHVYDPQQKKMVDCTDPKCSAVVVPSTDYGKEYYQVVEDAKAVK